MVQRPSPTTKMHTQVRLTFAGRLRIQSCPARAFWINHPAAQLPTRETSPIIAGCQPLARDERLNPQSTIRNQLSYC
jgi:hypothetical protein